MFSIFSYFFPGLATLKLMINEDYIFIYSTSIIYFEVDFKVEIQ